MCITMCKIDGQCKFNSWSRALKASALAEITQRGWVGREVRAGSGRWYTCTPMADSCQCMEKTTTIL